jgi:hypothetical protein
MAIPIKPPPTLVGKAAEEFYDRWANAKCSKSKEEVQAIHSKWKLFWEEQERLHPSSPW